MTTITARICKIQFSNTKSLPPIFMFFPSTVTLIANVNFTDFLSLRAQLKYHWLREASLINQSDSVLLNQTSHHWFHCLLFLILYSTHQYLTLSSIYLPIYSRTPWFLIIINIFYYIIYNIHNNNSQSVQHPISKTNDWHIIGS